MEHSTAPADDTLHSSVASEPTSASDHSAPDADSGASAPEAVEEQKEAAETAPSDSPIPTEGDETPAAVSAPVDGHADDVRLVDEAGFDGDEADEAHNEQPAADEPNGFAELGLSDEIQRALLEKGYRQPTPIQAQAIPTVLMGRDVLGCAQTGTGKTASFVLPMLDILSGSRARARMPRSLILEPTRELALQVAENFVQYGKHLKLTHALLIGGESLNDQKDVLMKGVDVLIATPGRLMDLFERGGLLLTDTALLVIDEADRMLDMGFIPDVEKIVGFLPKTRQTLFFSATMAPEIRRLADAFLQNPKEITVSRPASIATTIVAGLTVVDDLDKREALRRMLKAENNVQNALIFCNRKRDVDILFKSLKRHGFSVGQLHGDMSQPERFATLQRFKNNELQLLCCSDVAARGIDIGGLSHVFNFDVPIHAEDYVHRIGRTGRAGMTGHAFTLASPSDAGFVQAIEKLVGAEIPRFAVEGMDILPFKEDDGKRRGRGRTKPGTERAKIAVKETAREGDTPIRKPRRSRAKSGGAEDAPMPLDAPQPMLEDSSVAQVVAQANIVESAEADGATRAPREDRGRRSGGRSGGRSDGRSEGRGDRGSRSRDEGRRDEIRAEPEARAEEGRGQRDSHRASSRDGGQDDRVRAREEPRRHFRRDDDLGPAVIGFGDDVPAFMLLRSKVSRMSAPANEAE